MVKDQEQLFEVQLLWKFSKNSWGNIFGEHLWILWNFSEQVYIHLLLWETAPER